MDNAIGNTCKGRLKFAISESRSLIEITCPLIDRCHSIHDAIDDELWSIATIRVTQARAMHGGNFTFEFGFSQHLVDTSLYLSHRSAAAGN